VKDAEYMERAIKLAVRGLGHTRPNPAVGAVIVKGGKIIGEGWHKKAGGDHAEVAAIKSAARRGAKTLKGATIYVTLEPCSNPGRVGACTEAIIAAGISRVVYAIPDPNPTNRGKAKRALAKAGVKCDRFKGDKELISTPCHL
jgi:diaminohydroxyphosphoribosylaminopyrimidine deaminase/5-amino-6-(5-phosphoribosylamino)uracil reductase